LSAVEHVASNEVTVRLLANFEGLREQLERFGQAAGRAGAALAAQLAGGGLVPCIPEGAFRNAQRKPPAAEEAEGGFLVRQEDLESLEMIRYAPGERVVTVNLDCLQRVHDEIVRTFHVGDVLEAARDRGWQLLRDNLTAPQREQLDRHGWFVVQGSEGGHYVLTQLETFSVFDLRDPRAALCFMPRGFLVAGDVMLAQKIALETDEFAARTIANIAFLSQEVLAVGPRGHRVLVEDIERAYPAWRWQPMPRNPEVH
jgi:hypothetical protein